MNGVMNGGHGHEAALRHNHGGGGVYVPSRLLVPLATAILIMVGLQGKALLHVLSTPQSFTTPSPLPHASGGSGNVHTLITSTTAASTVEYDERLRGREPHTINGLRGVHDDKDTCRWYLAESAIPNGGLGVFTGIGLHRDDTVGVPDICIFVSDPPDHWTHLRSHTYGSGSFFGQYEGDQSRAACEGFATTYNTVPDRMVNTRLVSPVLATTAGLHRASSPGAGSITHHYGVHGQATDTIAAGSELTVNYGDWDFAADPLHPAMPYVKPVRPVAWLEQHGWCVDRIEIGRSRLRDAGRGAFARNSLPRGAVVAPAPLQAFRDRGIFATTAPEQLYVNYCLQPARSTMIFYPYGPAVNLVNHSFKAPNVEWRWSTNSLHRAEWLALSHEAFWATATPGGLVLELVAIRDIAAGEELLLNYGAAWEAAWTAHVAQWRPPSDAAAYVYPAEMDETQPLRTVSEQALDPYPANLATMCATADFDRRNGSTVEWSEATDWTWWEATTYCHILDRSLDAASGDYIYTVSLVFSYDPEKLAYDPAILMGDRFIDTKVPRRAIRFMEIPYLDDEHLAGAFRHPIELPEHLVPEAWLNVPSL